MGARQRNWARRKRDELRWVLGNECECCGCTEDLQFDCITPCGRKHHGYGWAQRMSFYRRQMRAGNLQLLCGRCNAVKGDRKISLVNLLAEVQARVAGSFLVMTPSGRCCLRVLPEGTS